MVAKDWWVSINDEMILENVSHMKATNLWSTLSFSKIAKMYPDLINEESDTSAIAKIGCKYRLIDTKEIGKFAKATVVRYGDKITSKDFDTMYSACRYALNQSGRSKNANVIYRVTFDDDIRVIKYEWTSEEYFNGSYMGTKKYSPKNRC